MKLTRENRGTRGKTCPSATLSTTNLTWTNPGSNPGLRGGRPAVNRLSHVTAYLTLVSSSFSPRHVSAPALTLLRRVTSNYVRQWTLKCDS
jgi:hypothetical protein